MQKNLGGFPVSKPHARATFVLVALALTLLTVEGIVVAAGNDSAGNVTAPASKTFVFHNSIRDLNEFRTYAQIAARLKRYGNVQVDLGVLAEKNPVHKVSVRSPWHEYGSYMATEWAFFPPPKLAPYLPAEWVAKNRELLLAKVAILKELKLDAVFSGTNTQFLPESFFQQYPQFRGPRVDNPVRSGKEAFAWCVDQLDTLKMIEWMTAELKRNAPMVQEIESWNNDSGSGICWLKVLYPGPNGPDFCRGRDPGERVRGLVEAMDRGARRRGGPVQIVLAGNFDDEDVARIKPLLPSYAKLRPGGTSPASEASRIVVRTRVREAYPVRGIIDVMTLLETLERITDPQVREVDIDTCQPWYFRTDEPIPVMERLVDLVEDSMRSPAHGLFNRVQRAHTLAARWAGDQNADRVMEAFNLVQRSFRYSGGFAGDVVLCPEYAYTATDRLLTRPLVIKPGLLTPEEESYFLPYVFSTEEQDARLDYSTAQGDRRTGPAEYHSFTYQDIHDSALESAQRFEEVARGAPEVAWFHQLALSLRLWASAVRSTDNFYFAQLIRDRHREDLAAPPRILVARSGTGDPDLLLWNDIQRDELDNTNELLGLLVDGGLDLVARARSQKDEDTFLYGPSLVDELRRKLAIMHEHWLDGQRFLTPRGPSPRAWKWRGAIPTASRWRAR